MHRLKASEVAGLRARMLREQGGVCLLCRLSIADDEAVLDHCHTTGEIRGVLHRGCNAMLGSLENNQARHRLMSVTKFAMFLKNVMPYLAGNLGVRPGVWHPTHKTADEKRELRNKRARVKRAKEKV